MELIEGVLYLIIALALYFLPALIAQHRGRDGLGMITLLNLILGWTVLGWIILLVVAFTGENAASRKLREEQTALLRQMSQVRQQSPLHGEGSDPQGRIPPT